MSVGRIGLGFSVNNFPVVEDFDIRVNVREDFNYLRYGSSFGLQNVGVSFLDSEPINVNDNIIINDPGWSALVNYSVSNDDFYDALYYAN